MATISAKYTFDMPVTETISMPANASVDDVTCIHDITKIVNTLTGSSTPAVNTAWSARTRTVTDGDIDLTGGLTGEDGGPNGSVNFNGKTIRLVWIKCASTNAADIEFKEHVTNGYGLMGQGFLVQLAPGASILLYQHTGTDAMSAVSTDVADIIDVNGTGADSYDICIVAG